MGRHKDLIITSGFNVYPVEVESVLKGAEGVEDVAVVGRPDAQRGEIVTAYVVMKSGHDLNETYLREHCRAHLSKHKRPKSFVPWNGELPKNFLGKVIRRRVREESDC